MTLILTGRKTPKNPKFYSLRVSRLRAGGSGEPVRDLLLEFRVRDFQVVKLPAGQAVLTPAARQAILAFAADLFANPELPIQPEPDYVPEIQTPPR